MYAYQRNGKAQGLLHRLVRFRISDVFVPEPAHVLAELHGRDVLQGKVIDLSDRGSQQNAFAVVEVDGLSDPVIVPFDKISRVEQ